MQLRAASQTFLADFLKKRNLDCHFIYAHFLARIWMEVKLVIAKGPHGVDKAHVLHSASPVHGLVAYFPGDRIERFGVDPEIQRLQDPWEVANLLAGKFPNHTVVLVTPRLEACCSCYDHFLGTMTLTGEPLEYRGSSFKASEQLSSLLEHAAGVCPGAPFPPCHVVGHSKGGVVLNQLLAELAAFAEEKGAQFELKDRPMSPCAAFLTNLQQFHYLDAGLNCHGAYLTNPPAFSALGQWQALKQSKLEVVLHGTPRQWGEAFFSCSDSGEWGFKVKAYLMPCSSSAAADPRRPHIAEERDRMIDLCRRYGVPVKVKDYFTGQQPSLKMHFDVIAAAEM